MNPFMLTVKRLDGTTHYEGTFATESERTVFVADAESKFRPFGFVKEGEYATLPEGAEQYVEEIRSRVIVEGQPARIDLSVDDEGNQVITEIPAVEEETELYIVYIVPKQYTIETEDITAQLEEEAEINALIAQGEADRECCQKVLALIGGINRTKLLTAEQITELQTKFNDIEMYLKANRPDTAKDLIVNASTDAVLFTESDKAKVLKVYEKLGK